MPAMISLSPFLPAPHSPPSNQTPSIHAYFPLSLQHAQLLLFKVYFFKQLQQGR